MNNRSPRTPWWRVLRLQLHHARLLGVTMGQARTMREGRPMNAAGEPIPWYTYPAIEYLAQFDLSGADVFEFGGGNSTAFWAERARSVATVESNVQWGDFLRGGARSNQTVLLRTEKTAYVNALLDQPRKFDVIAIDGRWRLACACAAPARIDPEGVIVLDNSDWYPQAARALRDAGLFQVDFSGFGPVNAYTWTTSIFVHAPRRLQAGFRAPAPVGGIRQLGDDDD